jgi:hypothetical protein
MYLARTNVDCPAQERGGAVHSKKNESGKQKSGSEN